MAKKDIKKDTIVYFGIIQFEYNNAMCQHVAGRKKLIENIGYKAIIIGVSPNVKRGDYKKYNDYSYVINDPQTLIERMQECISTSDIKKVLNIIGLEKIHTLIMCDFRFLPMKNMKRYCEMNNIQFAVDIIDWIMVGSTVISWINKIDCDVRMHLFYPRVKRRIYICSAYNSVLGEGKHTSVIPGVVFEKRKNIFATSNQKNVTKTIKLTFIGCPGLKCEKEKIDWIIRGISVKKLTNRYKLYLAGFDGDEFLVNNSELSQYITNNIIFCGRLKHEECMSLLRRSDFSLVIRPDTHLSKYGFSTKIGEAFSCGIPVIATDTSDNKLYITSGINGFICGCSYTDVANLLVKVARLNSEEILELKANASLTKALDYTNFLWALKKVIAE